MKKGELPLVLLLCILSTASDVCLLQADQQDKVSRSLAQYQVDVMQANIAPTSATSTNEYVEVFGQPRQSEGHPCTLLDRQDVEELKQALKTNSDAQKAFAALKARADQRIIQPLNVPIPQKSADGSWMYPGNFPVNVSPFQKVAHTNEANAKDMADLGMMYQLTGDEKYGEYCKRMLLAYADGYNSYGHPVGWTEKQYRSAIDGRLTGQFLEDGFWLCNAGFACDMVDGLRSWTARERAHVRDDLFRAVAAEFSAPVIGNPDYLSMTHNRSALCASAVLMAGYASEDVGLINTALYGTNGTREAPTGGLIKVHFGEQSLLPDGLWNEGSPTYQIQIASCALFNDAEILWHHGIDLYRHRDGALKRLLLSAIALSYPDSKMTLPTLHDSGRAALFDDRSWFNNEEGVSYECGYRRYRDQSFIPIIRNATKSLSMTIHAGPPSLFLDLPEVAPAPSYPSNVNFNSTGYGILRLQTADGVAQLIQEYGPSVSHGHPSKLGIDLYALGDIVMPFPGVIFPYNHPLDPKWYWTTLANSTMSVDDKSQVYFNNKYKYRNLPDPLAEQIIYGPASTMGIVRARSETIYPGVTLDRALFLTPNYLADIFGGLSDAAHTYDLAWHFRGTLATGLHVDPFRFPDPVADGYNAISNLTRGNTGESWNATVTTPGNKPIRFLSAGGAPTIVFLGNGHYLSKSGSEASESPPIIVQRRSDQRDVLFSNAVDISGLKNGYLKSLTQEGSLHAGYGLLRIKTKQGTDLCFSAFRPGDHAADGLLTDARQAYVRMEGENVSALYLGGGSLLKVQGGAMERSEAGLAYLEKTAAGTFLLSNPSPTDAVVTVTLPALAGLQAFLIDEHGRRGGPAPVTRGKVPDSFSIRLKAESSVEFGSIAVSGF